VKWLVVLMLLVNAGIAIWQVNFAALPRNDSVTAPVALPGHVNRLLLLSELEEERLRERTAVEINVPPPSDADEVAPESAGSSLCFSVGPLSSAEDVERVGDWLASLGGVSDLRESERREVSRFWVFLRPFASRAEALEQVEAMELNSIEDIYVIPRGDMANAISLGLYSRESSLERRLAELKSKGFEPEVAPRYESRKASWYDVQFGGEFAYPIDNFTEAFPGVEASKTRCT